MDDAGHRIDQLIEIERLGDAPACTGLEHAVDMFRRHVGRHDENRSFPFQRGKLRHDVETRHVREVGIEQNESWLSGSCGGETLGTRGGAYELDPGDGAQGAGHDHPTRQVVLDVQNDSIHQLAASSRPVSASEVGVVSRFHAQIGRAGIIEPVELDRDLLGSVSHELRGPLNGVLGLSSLLLNGTYGALTERQRTVVEMIEHSGRTLLGRIDTVVAFIGLLAEPPHPTTTLTDLRALATSAIGEPAPPNVTVDIAEGATAIIDPTIVGPIIEELVGNAVRNTPAQAPIVVAATTNPTTIVVRDGGRGIPQGMEEDVFTPFIQVHGDERSDERSGLGLARCRILAGAHGGSIELRSAGAGGCVVTLRL